MDCPACGFPLTLDVGPERPLSASPRDAVLAAKEDESIQIIRGLWGLRVAGNVSHTVESIETTERDENVVERAILLDEIIDELAAIDSLATLEDVLAEIRRHRRLEPATGDTEDGPTNDQRCPMRGLVRRS